MHTSRPLAAALLVLPLALAAACLGPRPDQTVRYYAIELGPAPAPAAAPADNLRVRRLGAAGHLREPMAVRTSDVTYDFLLAERWSEPPLAYLARALDRALFESGAFSRGEGGDASALDIELVAFELELEPALEAVCGLAVKLTSTAGSARLDRTIEARVKLAGSTPAEVARGLGQALDLAVQELVQALAGA